MDIQQALNSVLEGTSIDDAVALLLDSARTGTRSLTTQAQRAASSLSAKAGPKLKGMSRGFKHAQTKNPTKVKKVAGKIVRGSAALGNWWQ